MLIRIVKLSIHQEKTEDFLDNFKASESKIRQFPGNLHLELLRDKRKENLFFTYSHWENEEALENYRHSELFKNTWAKVKPLFNEKAEAWSLEKSKHLL